MATTTKATIEAERTEKVERAVALLREAAELLGKYGPLHVIVPAMVADVPVRPSETARLTVGKALSLIGGVDDGERVKIRDYIDTIRFLADMVE